MAHCKNPNKDNYPYIDSNDCTNFASQVLEQGGISQTNDWYCRKNRVIHVNGHQFSEITFVKMVINLKNLGPL